MQTRLDIVGPYPPPIGGISIHVSRMENLLINSSIPYRIYNHGSFQSENVVATNKSIFWYIKYLFSPKGKVVHFHNFFKLQFFYYFLFGLFFPKRMIITIHSEHLLNSKKNIRNTILFFLKRTNYLHLLMVSKAFSDYLVTLKIKNLYLPAYVPALNIKPVVLAPPIGKKFFMFSMWKVDQSTASTIYNIDLAFSLLMKIRVEFQMLFLIGTKVGSNVDYLNAKINKYNLQSNITIIFEQQFTDYINNCEFMIRCNNEDGYGVSLQESMDLGVPAIATDICIRPSGTVLFKRDSLEDLLVKVSWVINTSRQSILSARLEPTYHQDLLDLYNTHLESR